MKKLLINLSVVMKNFAFPVVCYLSRLTWTVEEIRPEVIKVFSCLTQLSMKFILINVMSVVGILTFTSRAF